MLKIKNFKKIKEYPSYFIKSDGSMIIKYCNQNKYIQKENEIYFLNYKNQFKKLDKNKYLIINNKVYRKIKISDNKIGYLFVKLHNDTGPKNMYIHRIMYQTFSGTIPNGMQINHINHKKYDNNINNLELVTPSENQKKAQLFYNKNILKKCKKCGNKIKNKSKTDICGKCKPNNKNRSYYRKVKNRPSKELLENLIQNNSFVKIGKMYNVSDNAVRKWCKSYGLPFRQKDILNHYNKN